MFKAGASEPFSLVRIITFRLALTSIVAILLQLGVVIVRSYLNDYDLMNSYVNREARALSRAIRVTPDGPYFRTARQPSHYYGQHAAAYAFRIVTDGGIVVAESNSHTLQEVSPWRFRPSSNQDLWLLTLNPSKKLHIAGGLRQQLGNNTIWIEVATLGDPARVYVGVMAAEVFDDVWMPMIPVVVLLLGVAMFSIRSSLRPLILAAKRAEAISPMDRGERFDPAKMPREAASFAKAINDLLDRVANLMGSQRMFIARAAHELRTPLAVIMLELDRLHDPRLVQLQADVRSMSDMVDRLLTLARLESVHHPEPQPVNLAKIVHEVVGRLRAWAEKRRHSINLSLDSHANIVGDGIAIREAIQNLIENAVKHTAPETQIEVTVGPESIVVEDNGSGMPFGQSSGEDCILPFGKRGPGSEGAGLGLAIVRQAMELHEGTLEIGRSTFGGAKFLMRFPSDRVGKCAPVAADLAAIAQPALQKSQLKH